MVVILAFNPFLNSSLVVNSKSLGYFAQIIINSLIQQNQSLKKVIITDLDMTLWDGVLGEDGPNGISAEPNGNEFLPFYLSKAIKASKKMLAYCYV